MTPIDVQAIRGKLWANGFRSIAVYSHDAVDWANRPMQNAGKRPKGDDWGNRARLTPPEAVMMPVTSDALNTGILCDGLIAIDLDIEDAAIVSQVVAAANYYMGSAPIRARSNSARILMLYRASEGEPHTETLSGNLGKVEALGHGKQFVAFGMHPSGVPYEWPYGSPDAFPRESFTAVSPEALQAFLCAVAPLIGAETPKALVASPAPLSGSPGAAHVTDRERNYSLSVLAKEVATLRAMTKGMGRNTQCNISAHSLGTMKDWIDLDLVKSELLEAMRFNGWIAENSESQARATIESGTNAGITKPRASLPDSDIDISTLLPVVPSKPQRAWPVELNADAYIGILGDFIRLEAPISEGDPNAMLIAALAMVGSICGRTAYKTVEKNMHHPRLFITIVGESSKARKGTTTGRAFNFAKMIDPTLETRLHKGVSSGEGLIEAIRDARSDVAIATETKKKSNTTSEDKGVADKRLLILQGEFGQTLQIMARPGNTLGPTLRDAWDGEQLSFRARNNWDVCREPHVTMVGNITKDELNTLISSNDKANGFGNRFLWVCARRYQSLPFTPESNEPALQALAVKAAHMIDAARYYGECGWMPDAASLWASNYDKLSSGGHGVVGAMTSRAEAQTLRIALIYAILDGSNNIDVPHLRAALEVWRYCLESAEFLFGGSSGNATADRILGMLIGMPQGASLTQISALFKRNKPSDELQRALDTLKASGLARSESRKTAGRAADLWFAC